MNDFCVHLCLFTGTAQSYDSTRDSLAGISGLSRFRLGSPPKIVGILMQDNGSAYNRGRRGRVGGYAFDRQCSLCHVVDGADVAQISRVSLFGVCATVPRSFGIEMGTGTLAAFREISVLMDVEAMQAFR